MTRTSQVLLSRTDCNPPSQAGDVTTEIKRKLEKKEKKRKKRESKIKEEEEEEEAAANGGSNGTVEIKVTTSALLVLCWHV